MSLTISSAHEGLQTQQLPRSKHYDLNMQWSIRRVTMALLVQVAFHIEPRNTVLWRRVATCRLVMGSCWVWAWIAMAFEEVRFLKLLRFTPLPPSPCTSSSTSPALHTTRHSLMRSTFQQTTQCMVESDIAMYRYVELVSCHGARRYSCDRLRCLCRIACCLTTSRQPKARR